MLQAILPFITAIGLSAVAAYYSVIGLAEIFPGSFYPIIIMGTVLEIAKLVTVSWLYNNWNNTIHMMRYYFLVAIVLLMGITSMGIFGYLSKAHIEHSSTIAPSAAKVQIYEEKIKALQTQIDRNNKNLNQYDEAVDQVMGRSKDEKGAEKASQIRKTQQKDRERIANENARLQKEIQLLTEEKLPLSLEVKKAESDLGPIKYVADVVYGTQDKDLIDKAVRLIIFVIIVVFDPLAVLLLIAANQTYRKQKKTKKPTKVIDVPAPTSVESFIDKKSQLVPKDKILNMTGELK
jgi:hypothetical protein